MLVSCICPTNNRRKFIPAALECFFSQDWPEKELIVVDDGTDRVEDLFKNVPGKYIYYLEPNLPAHRPKTPIGTKLNIAAEHASGEILCRWDDDDWSAPNRISDQVARLTESGKDVTGYKSMLFWNAEKKEASRYDNRNPMYALGSSLMYRKSYWQKNKFIPCSWGEDTDFTNRAQANKAILSVDGGQMMVARTHAGNTCKRDILLWPVVDASEIPKAFFEIQVLY